MKSGYKPPSSPGPREPAKEPPVQEPYRPGLERPSTPESPIPTSPLVIPSRSPSPMDISPVKEDMPASPVEEDMPAPPRPAPGHRYRRVADKLYKQMTISGNTAVKDLTEGDKDVIREAAKTYPTHILTKKIFPAGVEYESFDTYYDKTLAFQGLLVHAENVEK